MKIGDFVKSKFLIKSNSVGVIIATSYMHALLAMVMRVGYKETNDLLDGFERWADKYPDSESIACLVQFTEEVENQTGLKGDGFWVPVGDLELVEGEMA